MEQSGQGNKAINQVIHKEKRNMSNKELSRYSSSLAIRLKTTMDTIDSFIPNDKLTDREKNLKHQMIRAPIFSAISILKHISVILKNQS